MSISQKKRVEKEGNGKERAERMAAASRGEKNYQWTGPNKIVVCKNADCGKVFEVRPNNTQKYCSHRCVDTDPILNKERSKKIRKVLGDMKEIICVSIDFEQYERRI